MEFLPFLFGMITLIAAKESKRESRQIPLNLHPSLLASPIPFQADIKLGHHGVVPGNVQFKAQTSSYKQLHGSPGIPHGSVSLNIFDTPEYINKQIPNIQPPSAEQLLEEEWREFQMIYKKSYSSQEIASFRRAVFIENRAKIAKHNQEYSQGKRNFVQQMNPFGDLLFNEFNQLLNGLNRSTVPKVRIPTPTTYIPSANVNVPNNVDWRQVGAVTPVKNQGECASCWAFAAAGALEGHWFRKTSKLEDISEQDLLDCTFKDNTGCSGGDIDPAFQYVRKNNGVDIEEQYPVGYEESDKNGCRHNREGIVKCTGYVDLAKGDEKGLELAVATIGPVAVGIEVVPDFQFYSDGVYFSKDCSQNEGNVNHAMLIVGYGQEPNGQKYWLVKNSYGTNWGLGGYIKMAKDANNHCSIASLASYPLV
ncbi:procathepsin L-like [Anthonomus grandis grandis]|uniref:procathepsin L-like n=1 Tax=Anthonomus grandis grandis TaxID=2921223 RepID=UPI002166C02D|nr:procathepsin L-like [Anthonomus grandis grandis]